ncbi:glycosyltransferase [Candidatus Parcubacteria bacterium]|nr:glycosyltransferase [Candidatus Parcubacteria bacterium]
MKAKPQPFSNSYQNPILLSLLILLSVIVAVFYIALLLNPRFRGDWLPFLIVILAEIYIISQALTASWTVLSGNHDPHDKAYYKTQQRLFSQSAHQLIEPHEIKPGFEPLVHLYLNGRRVSVDVFITVYGEDIEKIRRTAIAARDMLGMHATYILDDGGSPEVAGLASETGVNYIARQEKTGAKAGNINNALSQTDGDFVVIFDADHVPEANFLYETLPFFQDSKVAFVQTPQFYTNKINHISRGASFAQDLFYRYICPGKNKFNSAFCVGTNVIFRRSALYDIGGLFQQSKSEDIWTSLRLHERGWISVFEPKVLAKGEAPDTIKAYIKQQQRWATGGMEIFFFRNPLFIKKLSLNQKLQYLWTTAFYFHGLATALLFFLPALYIVFGLSPINDNLQTFQWALIYGGFYGLQVIIASYSMRGFRLETFILSTAAFPVYLRALKNVIKGVDVQWNVTGRASRDSPLNYIVPQIILFIFLLIIDAVALINFYDDISISVALMWNLINTYVFGYFIYIAFREYRRKPI